MIVEVQNAILDNDFVKSFLFMLSGVYMGYTLNPVPYYLSQKFDNSYIFKFLILYITGVVAFHPLTTKKLISIVLGATITLYLFDYLRNLNTNCDENSFPSQ
jgi:hypothetical protein